MVKFSYDDGVVPLMDMGWELASTAGLLAGMDDVRAGRRFFFRAAADGMLARSEAVAPRPLLSTVVAPAVPASCA